ncbi:hypothetical protein ACS0TY_029410 [Phlomoides rotata]
MNFVIERCIQNINSTKELILTLIEELGSEEAANFGVVPLGKVVRAGPCLSWHRPSAGSHKVNMDAAFFRDSMQTGIGMVLRDDRGEFIAAKTVVYHSILDVDIGEAMGFMEALSWVKDLGLQNVVIEGDAKIVVDAINLKTEGVSAFHDVISICHKLFS